jgi:hypothetical protein
VSQREAPPIGTGQRHAGCELVDFVVPFGVGIAAIVCITIGLA